MVCVVGGSGVSVVIAVSSQLAPTLLPASPALQTTRSMVCCGAKDIADWKPRSDESQDVVSVLVNCTLGIVSTCMYVCMSLNGERRDPRLGTNRADYPNGYDPR